MIRLVLREVEVHAWPPNWRHEVCSIVFSLFRKMTMGTDRATN